MGLTSSHFQRTITELHGADGVAWLARLPVLIERCATRWSVVVEPPFGPLSYNYVAPAVRADGARVVLKAGVPNREIETEVAALSHYDGRGCVRLLESDTDAGVFLLERAVPGETLLTVSDTEATEIAAGVMRKFWRSVPDEHPFPTAADWSRGFERLRREFDGGTGPFDSRLVERAETLFGELMASANEPVVLHGDLHHWNILAAEREPWLAIDPKGVIGEPAYEVGAFLRNPMENLMSGAGPRVTLERRVAIFEERLGLDRKRMLDWTFAQAVLSAWWFYEDHGRGWQPTMEFASVVETLG